MGIDHCVVKYRVVRLEFWSQSDRNKKIKKIYDAKEELIFYKSKLSSQKYVQSSIHVPLLKCIKVDFWDAFTKLGNIKAEELNRRSKEGLPVGGMKDFMYVTSETNRSNANVHQYLWSVVSMSD